MNILAGRIEQMRRRATQKLRKPVTVEKNKTITKIMNNHNKKCNSLGTHFVSQKYVTSTWTFQNRFLLFRKILNKCEKYTGGQLITYEYKIITKKV